MHRLFGKSKAKVEAPTLEDTSGGIGSRIGDIEKKIDGLDNELRKYKEQLKKANGATATNIKKRAMDVLKRKRMYEAQRDQLANQQFNIDQTSFAIETVKSTHTTVAAMKMASKTLKKENKKISLDDIEDMQDEMEGGSLRKRSRPHCLFKACVSYQFVLGPSFPYHA
jgi:charged multivesicular body protein 5